MQKKRRKSLEASGQERPPSGCRAQLTMGMGFCHPFSQNLRALLVCRNKKQMRSTGFYATYPVFARSLQSACHKGGQLVGGKVESKPCSLNLAHAELLHGGLSLAVSSKTSMKSDSWREASRRWQMSSYGTAQEDQAPHMLCEKLDAAGDGSAALDRS